MRCLSRLALAAALAAVAAAALAEDGAPFDNSFAKHYFGSRGKVIGIDRSGHDHSHDSGRSSTCRETARGDRDLTPIEETVAICRSLRDDPLPIVPKTGPMAFSDRAELTNLASAEFLGRP